jgi:hypothetical protein
MHTNHPSYEESFDEVVKIRQQSAPSEIQDAEVVLK